MGNKGKDRYRRLLLHILQIAVLGLLLYFVFRNNYRAILEGLWSVGLPGFALLCLLGLGYLWIFARGHQVMVQRKAPGFTMKQSVELMNLAIFGKVATMGVSSLPAQSLYLHRCGIMPGDSVGMLILFYAIHKFALLASAGVLLLVGGRSLLRDSPQLLPMLILGALICVCIITGLVLVCTWKGLHGLVRKGLRKLPDNEKWRPRKEKILQNLDALYRESQEMLHNKTWAAKVFFYQTLKLLWLYLIPYFCMLLTGGGALSLLRVMVLTGLSLVIAGACPNVGGMGPTEIAFALLFSIFLEPTQSTTMLILYRSVTYFLPFLASIWIARRAVRRMRRS